MNHMLLLQLQHSSRTTRPFVPHRANPLHYESAMRFTILIRMGSLLASPRTSPTDEMQNSGIGASCFWRNRNNLLSPLSQRSVALRLKAEDGRGGWILRRARSEADFVGSNRSPQVGVRSTHPQMVVEDSEVNWCDLGVVVPAKPPVTVVDQVEYSGGGAGKGRKVGGGKGGGKGGDRSNNRRIADHYQQMLQSDPSNPLLLMNYGRFLHEVEGDAKGAEACYGRAILASPGDSEALSLYGTLVWETHRDEERAESYFERAIEASPDDCYMLGSYAHFLWDAEEEQRARAEVSSLLVEAF